MATRKGKSGARGDSASGDNTSPGRAPRRLLRESRLAEGAADGVAPAGDGVLAWPATLGEPSLLQTAFDAVPVQVALIDPDGAIVLANRAWQQLAASGWPQPVQVIDEGTLSVYCEAAGRETAVASELARAIRRAVAGEIPVFYRSYGCDGPDGTRWCRWRVWPTPFGDRQGAILVHEDVTEQNLAPSAVRPPKSKQDERGDARDAESRLRAGEERFGLFARATQDVIYDLDLAANTMWCNDRHFELFGETDRPPLEWWVAHLHPADRQRVSDSLQQAIQGGADRWAEDYRLSLPNGQYAYVMDRAFIMRDPSGRPVRLIGAATDITERKRAEEALRRAERLASIGTLAAGLAHEINNPLGAIVLSAEAAALAKDQPDREEILAASLNNIQRAALRCGRIVRSVLHFTRDEVSHKWPGDLADVARHARDVTRGIAAESRCTVRLEIADGLPPLVFNPTEMEQVFVNLISNAVQASDPQSEVLVRIEPWEDSARIVVHDRGRGMTPDELRHVFDPFYTTRRDNGGTGLGLSITYGIIRQHGGTIDVRSQLGRGTTVEIVLPPAGPTAIAAE